MTLPARIALTALALSLAACDPDDDGASDATASAQAQVALSPQFGTHSLRLRVDADGVLHGTYFDQIQGQVVYLRCEQGCEQPEQWSGAPLAASHFEWNKLIHQGSAFLELTPEGNPRVGFTWGEPFGPFEYHYAECDGDCTAPTAWTSVMLFGKAEANYESTTHNSRFFTLTPAGQPRMIVEQKIEGSPLDDTDPHRTQALYLYCDDQCTQAEAWAANVAFDIPDFEYRGVGGVIKLTTDAQGRPAFTITDPDLGELADQLLLAECTADCDTPAPQWTLGVIYSGFNTPEYDVRRDADGGFHAVASGLFGDSEVQELSYYHCAADCTRPESWTSRPLTEALGLEGVGFGADAGLLVGADGVVHVSFFTDHDPAQHGAFGRLQHARCAEDCTAEGAWTLETIADMHTRQDGAEAPFGEVGKDGVCIREPWVAAPHPTSITAGPTGSVYIGHTSTMAWSCGASMGQYVDPVTGEVWDDYVAETYNYSQVFVALDALQ